MWVVWGYDKAPKKAIIYRIRTADEVVLCLGLIRE